MKLIVKQILCIKLVKYCDKYIEMHGQRNVKKYVKKFQQMRNFHRIPVFEKGVEKYFF